MIAYICFGSVSQDFDRKDCRVSDDRLGNVESEIIMNNVGEFKESSWIINSLG